MRLREQLINIRSGFDISNNKFINLLAEGITRDLNVVEPALGVAATDRKSSEGSVKLVLSGMAAIKEESPAKIQTYMEKLRNPSEMLNKVQG
jgi:hypothetical protein